MRPSPSLVAACALALGAALRTGVALGTAPIATLEEVGAGSPLILFLFQPGDCPRLRPLVEAWNDLHRSGRIPVLGVGLNLPQDPDERARLVRESGIAFPVRSELAPKAERLALRLGYARTPVALLFDARGRPRLALPPLAGLDGAYRAVRLAADYAAALRTEAGEGSP